jgi:hypothetical protein
MGSAGCWWAGRERGRNPVVSLTQATLASFKNVGIRLNADSRMGDAGRRDYEEVSKWAEQYPEYPVEWLEDFEDTVKEQGINRFDTAMRYLHASAAQEIRVGQRPQNAKRQGEISESMLERHFAEVEERRQIEGTQEWKLKQHMTT